MYLRTSKYELLMRRRAPIPLIVHVGAHWGEDAGFYETCGANTVLWVEADPDTFATLKDTLGGRQSVCRHIPVNALISSEDGQDMAFHRFNADGASSSVHTSTETYRARFPDSRETGEVLNLASRSLGSILADNGIDVGAAQRSMLVVDVQGHEFEVLQGLGDAVTAFSQVKCEVSRLPMYEGGAMFTDIDAHLTSHGFKLASHRYSRVPRHGDVLYIQG